MRVTHTIGLLMVAAMVGALLTWLATRSPTADLERRIETAERPEDHAAIAPIVAKQAERYEVVAVFHRKLAAKYQRAAERADSPPGGGEGATTYREMAAHCLALAEGLERAAGETRALAHGHERLAAPREARR